MHGRTASRLDEARGTPGNAWTTVPQTRMLRAMLRRYLHILAVLLWGCAGEPRADGSEEQAHASTPGEEAQACPVLPTGVQHPVPVQTSFDELPALTNAQLHLAIADEQALFWLDSAGAVYSWPHDSEQSPTQINPSPDETRTILRLTATESELIWADAGAYSEMVIGIPPPRPPGRLYSMPKQGGEPQLLRESADAVMHLVAATNEQVWFLEPGPDGEEVLYSLAREDGSVSQVTSSGEQRSPQVIDEHVYWWTEGEDSSDENGYYQDLSRQKLNGGLTEFVTSIEGSSYDIIGQRVAWVRETTHFDPLVLQEHVVIFDMTTNCQHVLPSDGLTISAGGRLPLVDSTHVYWLSFNGLGTVSNPSPAGQPTELLPEPSLPLLRVSLDDGSLEQLVVDGLRIPLGSDTLVAHTSRSIYVRSENGLVRVNKPAMQ